MSHFAATNGLVIAPHGKTTMAPQLYDLQIADGAWAITVATGTAAGRLPCASASSAWSSPTSRSAATRSTPVFARSPRRTTPNSIVSPTASRASRSRRGRAAQSAACRTIRCAFWSRSASRVAAPVHAARTPRLRSRVPSPGRPGWRLPASSVSRVSCPVPDEVDGLPRQGRSPPAGQRDEMGILPDRRPLVLSAGGSSFFDRVGERFARFSIKRPLLKVLRSGCYLVHDVHGYARAFQRILGETTLPLPAGASRAGARSLGACPVASRPEARHPDAGQARCRPRCRPARCRWPGSGPQRWTGPWRSPRGTSPRR